VALCGTYVSPELAAELAFETMPSSVIVALDPGAEKAAARARETLAAHFDAPVQVVYIPQDIKDMADVQGFLRKIKGTQ
jgi:hypothetical protein